MARSSSGGDFRPKTNKGYDLFEASSALQKSIRRGDEDTALYFAVELWKSGYGEYAWKRLKIISSEDVGLAEPNISANIQALYQMYLDQSKKSDSKHSPERLFLTHAVLMLVRAKKSRLVDWTLVTYFVGHDDRHLEIPDVALDKHTVRGRAMGRGFEHFFDEGSKLENHKPQTGEEKMKERARKLRMNDKSSEDEAEQATLF